MEPPHLPTETLAASCPQTARKWFSPVPPNLQKKPLARAIQQLERKISRDKDWVADDAVCCKLPSASNSLIIRENTGNFRDFGRLGVELGPNKPCLLSSFCRNSLLNRTGNYFDRTGDCLQTTGKPVRSKSDKKSGLITAFRVFGSHGSDSLFS